MSEVMTIEAIRAQFDSEWVLLEDPETTDSLEVKSGKLLWHSKDRAEIGRKEMELRPNRSAVLYIGKPPKDLHFVL